MSFVDLHLHTRYSDGSDAPETVVARAVKLGLAAIAITDHDTFGALPEALEAVQDQPIELLSGVEISCGFENQELHVLGLGIDIYHSDLLAALADLRDARMARAEHIAHALKKEGIHIDLDRLRKQTEGGVVGRMHLALELNALGVTRHPQESFDRYLKPGRPAYTPKVTLPVAKAVNLIRAAKGLSFIAHPCLGRTTRRALPKLLQLPFDGLEAYHTDHSPGRTQEILTLAEENNLLVSGGSDCHGNVKGKRLLGSVATPLACYERIKDALAEK